MKNLNDVIGASISDAVAKLTELGFIFNESRQTFHSDSCRVSLCSFFTNMWQSHKRQDPIRVDMVLISSEGSETQIFPKAHNPNHHFLLHLPNDESKLDIQAIAKQIARQ